MMNKIIVTLSIAVAAFIGYCVGKNSNISDSGISQSSNFEPIGMEKPELEKKPSNFNEKNFQHMAAAHDGKPGSPDSEQTISQEDSSAVHQIDAIKTDYEFKQRSEAFTSWLIKAQESKPGFDLGVEMRARFDAEDTDHDWAIAEEEHLQSLFTRKSALAGIALKSTSCKSTQCQIRVGVMSLDHANEMAIAISNVLGGENFSQVIVDNQAQQGETILYVSRNEKGFEFN